MNYMNYKKFFEQLASGIVKTPKEIAVLVKLSKDPAIILWALRRSSVYIRKAAVSHPMCHFSLLLKASLFDPTKTVRVAAIEALKTREDDLNNLLRAAEIMSFPQLTFPFFDKMKKKKTHGIDYQKFSAKDFGSIEDLMSDDNIFSDEFFPYYKGDSEQ